MTVRELKLFHEALDRLDDGDLEGTHKAVQELEGIPAADTIHAIVHRREGDFQNSCYWWRRVGPDLPPDLRALYGDPIEFVERCRQTIPGSAEAEEIAEVERKEIELMRAMLPQSWT
jgi:hypothetical protein